jgi:hypothetical protein
MDPERPLWNFVVALSYAVLFVVGIPVFLYAAIRWALDRDHSVRTVRETVSRTTNWGYDRQDLRDAHMFTEHRCRGVDPRTLLRALKRETQEVTRQNVFKYTIREPDGRNPSVGDEPVGQRVGRVVGRFVATTEWKQFHRTETERHSLPILPAVLGLLGLLLFFVGLETNANDRELLVGLGLIVLLGAGAAYYFRGPTTGTVEYDYRKRSRVLLRGEVGERTSNPEHPRLSASDVSIVISEEIEARTRGRNGTSMVSLTEFSTERQQQLSSSVTPLASEIDFGEFDPVVRTRRGALDRERAGHTRRSRSTKRSDSSPNEETEAR